MLTDPQTWLSLATLTLLEIVLGIDNLIFLSIISQRAPESQQKLARRLGLLMALITRIALLLTIAWMMRLTEPFFELFGHEWSGRDLILMAGGLFLLYKATTEIHEKVEGGGHGAKKSAGETTLMVVIVQIAILDIVFSLDSVLTAIGLAEHVPVMVTAIVIAMIVMLVAAEPLSAFVAKHPTVEMLALSFLLLIGVALVADGLHFHIPKGYLYFAVAFSVLVEVLNQVRDRRSAA